MDRTPAANRFDIGRATTGGPHADHGPHNAHRAPMVCFCSYLPEAWRLVGSGGGDGGAIGGSAPCVQNAARVPAQLGDAHHRGVLPQDELVVRVALRRDELLVVRRPLQSCLPPTTSTLLCVQYTCDVTWGGVNTALRKCVVSCLEACC